MRFTPLVCFLVACGAATDIGSDMPSGDPVLTPPDLPNFAGTCPSMVEGTNTIEVAGFEREVEVWLPPDPEGAPVIFAWHFLSGDPTTFVEWFGLDALGPDNGAIVIAPKSRSIPQVEWDTWEGNGSADLKLFDALLVCAWEQWQVDGDRIYATGFSAGGLWMSTLTQYRSKYLAATAPLSGGATQMDWSPKDPIPMLLTWGGPSDTYGGFSFEDANNQLLGQLEAEGQFAATCVHDSGHLPPPGGVDYLWDFFEAHPKGVATSPWEAGLPGSLPGICSLPY